MAELDELCDLLEEEEEEEADDQEQGSASPDQDEAELQAMLAKVEALKAKVASKKKPLPLKEVDMFTKETSEPLPSSPFLPKPNKPIKLHEKTPNFGPAKPSTVTRVISGKEKEDLLKRIRAGDEAKEEVKKDLELSSDEEGESHALERRYSDSGRTIKKNISSKEDKSKPPGFRDIQGSTLNISNPSANKKAPSNVLHEKNSRIRIRNPLITQPQLDLHLIDRSFISIFRLQSAISRKETEGKDWSTIGIIFYKNVTTSKNGNTYTMWKLTDLTGGEPVIVSVMLFGRAHSVHYKMPKNKVVGILNPKVLDTRGGGGSSATLSVDHPDKIMEMGDALDVGRCKGSKADGSPCTNLVNASTCEYCTYHVKKAYKNMSSKRSDLQSSFSGVSNPRSRIMTKIDPKGEVFAGGQAMNSFPSARAGQKSSKLIQKDAAALRTLGVIPSEIRAENSRQKALSKERILEETKISAVMSAPEKEVMRKALDEGVSQDLAERLLLPSPGARVLLKHLTKNAESQEEKEAVEKGCVKTAKSLLSEHQKKLRHEAAARRVIEERKNTAKANMSAVPKLGKGLSSNDGFIDLGGCSPSRAKALLALKGKAIPKVNPNNVKRKRLPEEALASSKVKVAKVLSQQESTTTSSSSPSAASPDRPALRGLNGSVLSEERLEALKGMKSKNVCLAEEEEDHQRDKYFDVLEKKDAMEDKMINTREMEVRAVVCSECNVTAYAQSDLCREKGHRVKSISAKKRFFECSKCKNRTTCLDKYPKKTCDKCGDSGWKRVGMMREKKAVMEHEKLLIRGQEQKNIGSVTSKVDLDSIS